MTAPTSLEELNARATANIRIEGYGLEVRTVAACPWCGAPDWATWPVTDFEYKAMQTETTCSECGRSGKIIVTDHGDGSTSAEIVQTGGDDPPDWLAPAPRRV